MFYLDTQDARWAARAEREQASQIFTYLAGKKSFLKRFAVCLNVAKTKGPGQCRGLVILFWTLHRSAISRDDSAHDADNIGDADGQDIQRSSGGRRLTPLLRRQWRRRPQCRRRHRLALRCGFLHGSHEQPAPGTP